MTATQIQDIARRLSNQTWCRYWLNLNDSTKPVTMAIQCLDENGETEVISDIESLGFRRETNFLYTITRTNEDGTEYESKLF